jgi:hypothetical protein
MFRRFISALLIFSLLTITAVPAGAETVAFRPGGYYYEEYIYDFTGNYTDYPDFLFGAGDYLYAVAYDRDSANDLYKYIIYAFDREAKLKTKYILPYDKNQRYLEFSCDTNGLITLTVFIPYEDNTTNRLKGDRVVYNLVGERLVEQSRVKNFIYTDGETVDYKIVQQTDDFYNAGETDIKSVKVSGGNLYGTFRDGKSMLIANKEVIEVDLTRDKYNTAEEFADLQRGDFAIITDYSRTVKIFRKTEQKHADLHEFYVGYTGNTEYEFSSYINAYNLAHDDFVALPVRSMKADAILTSRYDPNYSEMLANGSFKDLYEFMGKGYFDKEKIILNLLQANETDGKLYTFSPVWKFDIMTANADIVTADDFSSFEKMVALEKESSEKRLFWEKTREDVFGSVISQVITEYYDETGKADIDPALLETVKEFALLYPTEDEYRASEDYDKADFRNYFGYYEGGDSPAYYISQFDIGDYRSGRYAAAVFTGPTIPVDSDYEDEYFNNIFRNFSSFVNILYKGNFTLPGFWGKGYVKGTPADFHTAAVSSTAKNTDGAKSFINFLLTEYDPGYYYSLSADVLERQAEEAVGLSRTHERGGKLVRDTIYFSSNDYFEMPDVTGAEVMPLLNAIKYGSFPAEPHRDYYYYYDSIFYGENLTKYLDGKLSAEEYAKLLEEELK